MSPRQISTELVCRQQGRGRWNSVDRTCCDVLW